jgi:predicted transcriptional regulator
MSTTVRVSTTTRDRLAAMAETAGRPMTSIIDEALDALERRQFFAALNLRYGQLRDDVEQWSSIGAERAEESAVLRDAER